MMYTLKFNQCLLNHMKPCANPCPNLPRDRLTCESLVKTELIYYDDSLALIIFDNPILDRIGPEILRDRANKAFAAQRKIGLVGDVRVFSPKGHAE